MYVKDWTVSKAPTYMKDGELREAERHGENEPCTEYGSERDVHDAEACDD